MDWYYAVNQERKGPVDSATFSALIKSGDITKLTLVWNQTMTDWTLLKDVDHEDIPKQETPEEQPPKVQTPVAASSDPYAAPRSDITPRSSSDNAGFSEPQRVPVGNVITWITNAFSLFTRNPFKWLLALFLAFVIMGVLSLIPFLGSLITMFLYPVILGGFMIGAKAQDDGEDFTIGHMFAGFSNNFGQLVLFGFLYFVSFLLIFIVAGVLMAVTVGFSGLADMGNAGANPFDAFPIAMILIILVFIMLTIPVMMMYWFSPALIAINNIPAFTAMMKSFRACLTNFVPFLVYGLIGFILWAVLFGIMGIVAAIFSSMGDAATAIAVIVMFLVMIIVAPVGIISIYTSYRDIFYQE